MNDPAQPPRRVRVTGPRTVTDHTRTVHVTREIDAHTELGEIYMSSLLRSQLRLALAVLTLLGAFVGVLPVLFHTVPALAEVTVAGMPLPWVVLAFAGYPLLPLWGWLYVRAAERNERAFTDVAGRPEPDVPDVPAQDQVRP